LLSGLSWRQQVGEWLSDVRKSASS
jgi:hypothetical protein